MNKIPESELKILFPEFTDISELRSGGFKTVYRAVKASGELEALKVVAIPDAGKTSNEKAHHKEEIGRVIREISILGKSQSPHIVRLAKVPLTHKEYFGKDFVVYSEEFLDGGNLWDPIIDGEDKPSEIELRELLRDMLKAIKELHRLQVVHRDIKPLNIMKSGNSERPFILIDLGIAFSLQGTALTANAENRRPMATYRYISPEQCDPRNRANLDYRSDLYSLALTVFEYAAHEHPIAHDMDDFIQTVSRALNESPKALKDLRPDLSPEFCGLVDQLLKKRPALRPANLNMLIKKMEAS